MIHLECLKGILWFCCVCYNVVGDIAFVRFAGMARPNQPAGASRGSDGLHGNRKAGMDRASACLSTSSRGGAMGSEVRIRRSDPDTVRLWKHPDWPSDGPQANRNGESPACPVRRSPGTGRFGGWYGRRMTPSLWLPPDLMCCAGRHSLRDRCSVGPRTHAASQDG